MNDKLELGDDSDLFAAELALGLLNGDDRVAAESRLNNDASFAAFYCEWQERAALMLRTSTEEPRPWIWHAIAAQLSADRSKANRAVANSRLRFWRTTAAITAAAASVLALVVIEQERPRSVPAIQRPAQQSRELVAMLGPAKGAAVAVTFQRGGPRLVVLPQGLDIGAHSAELWVIPNDGIPRSLGVFSATVPVITYPSAKAAEFIEVGATFAVSVEPIGGSRTGLPTGPVILKGTATKV